MLTIFLFDNCFCHCQILVLYLRYSIYNFYVKNLLFEAGPDTWSNIGGGGQAYCFDKVTFHFPIVLGQKTATVFRGFEMRDAKYSEKI